MDGGGVGADGPFQVLPGRAFGGAKLDELGPGQLQAPVVPIALAGLDQDLILHAGGVGQLFNLGVVVAGHAGRGGQRQR